MLLCIIIMNGIQLLKVYEKWSIIFHNLHIFTLISLHVFVTKFIINLRTQFVKSGDGDNISWINPLH